MPFWNSKVWHIDKVVQEVIDEKKDSIDRILSFLPQKRLHRDIDWFSS